MKTLTEHTDSDLKLLEGLLIAEINEREIKLGKTKFKLKKKIEQQGDFDERLRIIKDTLTFVKGTLTAKQMQLADPDEVKKNKHLYEFMQSEYEAKAYGTNNLNSVDIQFAEWNIQRDELELQFFKDRLIEVRIVIESRSNPGSQDLPLKSVG